jgi:hypothetical protein
MVRKVMVPGTNWVEMPTEEGLPRYALHVYGMPTAAVRTWQVRGEAPALVTIRGNDKNKLRAMAYEYVANGLWIDDELWPPHQIHHCWLQTLDEAPVETESG